MAQTSQELGDRPPTYTAPNPMPMNTGAVPSKQFAITPQPVATQPWQQQPGFIIQNVPVAEEPNCCADRSDGFKLTAGVITGTLQLVIAVICIVLSSITLFWLAGLAGLAGPDSPGEMGYEIVSGKTLGAAVMLFIPAGILGVLTKTKNNCVIISYLVMSILSAIDAFFLLAVHISASVFFYFFEATSCQPIDYVIPSFDDSDIIPEEYNVPCQDQGFKGFFAIHVVLAVICFIEFVVAIVGAAFCCGGLRCCCKSVASTVQHRTVTMMNYSPLVNEQQSSAMPIQGEFAVVQDSLPEKA